MISDFYHSKLGEKLRVNAWYSDKPIANIIFVHGFGEHSKRYHNEAQYFNTLGFNFLSYDQRTHGESSGSPRGYIKNFDNYIKEYEEVLTYYLENDSANHTLPCFLMSHSMGGLVMLSYLLKSGNRPKQYKGAIFSSPFLMPNKDTAPFLQKISHIVAALLPKLKTVKIDAQHISRDPNEQKSYVSDPLNYHEGIYAATASSFLKQMKKISPAFKDFNDPYIIQHGTDDQLAEFLGSQSLFDQSKSEDKTLIPLKDYRHEITRELEWENVLKTYSNWMLTRL